MNLTEKWNHHELKQEDIDEYLVGQAKADSVKLTDEERATVAYNIFKIYETVEELRPDYLGHFLTAIRGGDYEKALARADLTNRKALILYLKYFHNQAPSSYHHPE